MVSIDKPTTAAPPKTERKPPEIELTERAEQAALDGDCETVKKLEPEVKQLLRAALINDR